MYTWEKVWLWVLSSLLKCLFGLYFHFCADEGSVAVTSFYSAVARSRCYLTSSFCLHQAKTENPLSHEEFFSKDLIEKHSYTESGQQVD